MSITKSVNLVLILFVTVIEVSQAKPLETAPQLPADVSKKVEAQIQALNSPDVDVRRVALKTLADMGEEAAPAAPFIVRLLGDVSYPTPDYIGSGVNHSIGDRAVFALRAIGRLAVPAVVVALKSNSVEARRNAVVVLSRIEDSSVAEPLIAALRDEDSGVRERAKFALTGWGANRAKFPINPFLIAFRDTNPFVRQVALLVLARIQAVQGADKQGVEAVFQALKDTNPDVKDTALRVLAAARTWIQDERAVEPLIQALTHKDSSMRQEAACSLSQYKDIRAVQPLVAQLKDESSNARSCAAWALGKMGFVISIDALTARLKDEQVEYVRNAVADALGNIGNAKALEPLFQNLRDPDKTIRFRVGRAIEKITGRPYQEHPLWQKLREQDKHSADD